MQITQRPLWQRLTIAPLAVLAALLIRLALTPLTGTEGPFLLFFSAVLLSAWVGGHAASVLATALAASLAALVFLHPSLSSGGRLLGPAILIALFVLDALLISRITDRLQATVARATRQQAELASLIDGVQDYAGLRADGSSIPLEASIARLTVNGEPFYGAILRDISTRMAAEQALRAAHDELEFRVIERTAELAAANTALERQAAELRASEARFQAFMDHSPAAAWITDGDGTLHYASATYYRTFALPTPDVLGKSVFELYPETTAQAFLSTTQAVVARGEALEMIERALRPDGRRGEFLVYKFPLAAGDQPLIGGVAVDITQLRETELRLRASLHEKELLLKEIHHRVKNNLQVVMSLLRLQSRQVSDAQALAALRESRQRVEVMALVHELLYRTGDLAAIDADAYIRQLSTQLLRLYDRVSSQVTLSLDAAGIWLSLDQAVPCGLIINELLSNSLKYAFPHGQSGTVGITLHATAPELLTLTVWDTGVGLPTDPSPPARPSLGMTLVQDLVRQLRGTTVTTSDAGLAVRITFPQGLIAEPIAAEKGAP